MKAFLFLIHCIAFTLSTQAWAASDSQSCESRSQQLRGAAKENFLRSCLSQTLAQTSSPEHVRANTAQEKRNTCEQNAKNMKLEGGNKAEYLNDCMNTNVAANEARKAGMQEHLIADKSTNHPKEQAVAKQKPAADKQASKRTAKKKTDAKPKVSLNACSKQATQQKLKGKERTHFIHDCRKG